ncbi:MAG: F0F1 ATP synthase subunit alpha [Candidatus Omnitrophica bacterium]|nr:F0F1 ATP synthase subunit alpha [Candidatus Omnitrophota bacterium]
MGAKQLQYTEAGVVKAVRGCIVLVRGLHHCINGQLMTFGYGTMGMVIGFNEQEAQVLIIKETEKIKAGDKAIASIEPFEMPVGEKFIGRIVNVLAEPLDGLGPIAYDQMYPIFSEAPPILARQPLNKTLETGIKVLDVMTPIGLGQRELILGDKGTGKTTFVTDTILNQKHTGLICIYVAIGKPKSALAKIVQLFKDHDCFKYSLIICAGASSVPGQQYLAPYVACSVAEYFLHQGKNVFIGFDDLTKHAWCYREISLLLGRPPGRDSYPGDIFYLHSKMIERACYLDEKHGGGSMTFFPIVEILEGDLTAFVPSNLVSMTDGQIYLSSSLFGEGQKPALDLGLSISRVGSKVQWPAIKSLSGPLRLEYLQYRELLRISKLKTTGYSDETLEKLKRGAILTEILRQDKDRPVIQEIQVMIFYAFTRKMLDELTIPEVRIFQDEILEYTCKNNPDLLTLLKEKRRLDPDIEKGISSVVGAYVQALMGQRKQQSLDQRDDEAAELQPAQAKGV